MARIKLGPLVTDIAGSVGGATFQRNRFGMTMRNKPLPLYSQTPAQFKIRRLIAFLQYSWQDLTDPQRLQWNRFLDFSGQTIRRDRSIKLSGQTLYIKYQLYRIMQGLPLLTTLAYVPMPDYIIPDHLTRVGSELYIHFPGSIDKDTYFFHFKLTNPRTQNQAFNPAGLRFMKTSFIEAGLFYIQVPYIAAFGVLPTLGQWHHFSIMYYSVLSPVFTGFYTDKIQSVSP